MLGSVWFEYRSSEVLRVHRRLQWVQAHDQAIYALSGEMGNLMAGNIDQLIKRESFICSACFYRQCRPNVSANTKLVLSRRNMLHHQKHTPTRSLHTHKNILKIHRTTIKWATRSTANIVEYQMTVKFIKQKKHEIKAFLSKIVFVIFNCDCVIHVKAV